MIQFLDTKGEAVKFFIYILILAVAAMFYKTFYYDYQKREIPAEANTSISAQTPEISQPQPAKVVEPIKDSNADDANRTGWQSRKGMPIDRLGDSIGASLKDKVKVK